MAYAYWQIAKLKTYFPHFVESAYQRSSSFERYNLLSFDRRLVLKAGIQADRKILADLAVNDAAAFTALQTRFGVRFAKESNQFSR